MWKIMLRRRKKYSTMFKLCPSHWTATFRFKDLHFLLHKRISIFKYTTFCHTITFSADWISWLMYCNKKNILFYYFIIILLFMLMLKLVRIITQCDNDVCYINNWIMLLSLQSDILEMLRIYTYIVIRWVTMHF